METAIVFFSLVKLFAINFSLLYLDICNTLFKMKGQQQKSKFNWGGIRPGSGRPALGKSKQRRHIAVVRLNRAEKAVFCGAAERSKVGLSEWIRQTLLLAAAQL
jgi:hypothetical protein